MKPAAVTALAATAWTAAWVLVAAWRYVHNDGAGAAACAGLALLGALFAAWSVKPEGRRWRGNR